MTDSLAKSMSRILLTIPAWNEEQIIAESLHALHAACQGLLPGQDWVIEVVDNGSTDRTANLVREAIGLGRVGLRQCTERGKGLAIASSWEAGQGYEVYAFMDADLSTDLAALPALLAPILAGEADIVCGSRFAPGAKVERSAFRLLLSRAYSLVQRVLLGLPVRDAQCGFKAVSPRVVADILPSVQERGYLFDTELLALAAARAYPMREIPVDWKESARRSRVRPFADGMAFLPGLLAMRKRITI